MQIGNKSKILFQNRQPLNMEAASLAERLQPGLIDLISYIRADNQHLKFGFARKSEYRIFTIKLVYQLINNVVFECLTNLGFPALIIMFRYSQRRTQTQIYIRKPFLVCRQKINRQVELLSNAPEEF